MWPAKPGWPSPACCPCPDPGGAPWRPSTLTTTQPRPSIPRSWRPCCPFCGNVSATRRVPTSTGAGPRRPSRWPGSRWAPCSTARPSGSFSPARAPRATTPPSSRPCWPIRPSAGWSPRPWSTTACCAGWNICATTWGSPWCSSAWTARAASTWTSCVRPSPRTRRSSASWAPTTRPACCGPSRRSPPWSNRRACSSTATPCSWPARSRFPCARCRSIT